MKLNRSNLCNNFKDLHIQNEKILFNEETLNSININFNKAIETRPNNIVVDKPYGIVAIFDTPLNQFRVTTFHYVDFRWFSIQLAAKIMHKAKIEERKADNGSSTKFSKSPMRYSGDVCGIMRGDFRECFNAIKEKEEANQLLQNKIVEVPNDRKSKINIQCGIGLESLTRIEKITKENPTQFGLTFIK